MLGNPQKRPGQSSAGRDLLFEKVSWSPTFFEPELHHLYVDGDAGWQVDIGKSFDDLGLGIEDVDHALVDAHFELFAGVFVDKGGAIDGVFFDIDR